MNFFNRMRKRFFDWYERGLRVAFGEKPVPHSAEWGSPRGVAPSTAPTKRYTDARYTDAKELPSIGSIVSVFGYSDKDYEDAESLDAALEKALLALANEAWIAGFVACENKAPYWRE